MIRKISKSFWMKISLFGMGATISALLLGFAWVWVEADSIYQYSDSVDGVNLPEVDAIACLAGGRGRIAACADLWLRYAEKENPPVLYFSGMGNRANWKTVQSLVRPGVLKFLRPDQVVIETESTNTVENALWFSRYAHERGWDRVLLMTSRYHMKRATALFEHYLKGTDEQNPIRLETLSIYQEPFEPGEWRDDAQGVRVTITEYFKYVYYKKFLGLSQEQISSSEVGH
jgi:hypothetical protein